MSFEEPTEQLHEAPAIVEQELNAPSALAHATSHQSLFTEVWEETWPSLQDLEVSNIVLGRLSLQL